MKIQIYPPQAFRELGSRSNQEDALWPPLGEATAATRLFVVCDGMGGHDHGEVASATVAGTLGKCLGGRLQDGEPFNDDLLHEALGEAYRQLDANDVATDSRKMGTTLTLVAFHSGGVTMAHIGDSRIYHFRPSERRVLYQSRDHSLVMELYLSGELSEAEVATYEGKNIVTRAMMPAMERRPKADVAHTTDLQPGDYFMLCSDGVLESLSEDDLLHILSDDATSDEEKCRRLVELTDGNSDNHTAYLIRIADVQAEPADASAPNDEAGSRCNMLVLRRQREAETPAEKPQGWLRRALGRIFE